MLAFYLFIITYVMYCESLISLPVANFLGISSGLLAAIDIIVAIHYFIKQKRKKKPPQKEKTLEDEIENIIKNRKHVFCPVIKSMCRTDCTAFETPVVKVVREAPPAHKYISGGVCTHAELKHKSEDRQ